MNSTDHYLSWLLERGGCVTLGEIMQTNFVCEYRKYHSLLRDQGYTVKCIINRKEPGKNLYILEEPRKWEYEGDQAVMFR